MNQTDSHHGFDRIASLYDALLWLGMGRSIHAAQLSSLGGLVHPRRILLVGGGTGKLLAALLARYPQAEITSVDVSGKMIAISRRRVPAHDANRVVFRQVDVRQFSNEMPFDLVVTPFVLDCFSEEEAAAIVRHLATLLAPAGRLAFADFQYGREPGGFRLVGHFVVALLYRFFRVVCGISGRRLPDWSRVFPAGTWEVEEESVHWGGMMVGRCLRRKPFAPDEKVRV